MNIDPEFLPALDALPPMDIDKENLFDRREQCDEMAMSPSTANIVKKTIMVPDNENNRDILVYIFQSTSSPSTLRPALLWMHGGGYVIGNADSEDRPRQIADKLDITVISVEYRLAPEHPYPAAIHDCFTVLQYIASNVKDLHIDEERIAIGGNSTGGGLAASLALMNRDKNGPKLAFQLLIYPMLDNLHDTESGQIPNHYFLNRQSSLNAWEMYFNGSNPGLDASPYAAAARATGLKHLPATYISVGTEDLFRDEVIDYSRRLMKDGVACELAVFPGLCHAGERFVPQARVSWRFEESYLCALGDALLCSGSCVEKGF